MSYESFIAKRYMHSGRFFVSVSTWISILGVLLGVAVVCFVMSLHNGFQDEMRDKLLGTSSHISIFPLNNETIDNYLEINQKVESVAGVEASSPFIYYKTAISSSSEGDGVMVRGIIPEFEEKTASIKENMVAGEYDFRDVALDDDTLPGLVIGSQLANRLGVYLGESVVLYSLTKEVFTRRSQPRVMKFYVSGIFETGLHDFDNQLVYISLEAAQKLFKVKSGVTAIHLKITDVNEAPELAREIDSVLGYEYDVVPWTELYKQLFSWIELEKLVLFLGFILIVLVAAFSIVSALTMMTMEKRPEIGILKTIGATPGSVLKIFIYKGLAIGLIGTFSGFALALLAIWAQNTFEIISLPPDIYFITYLPFVIHWYEFAGVGVITVAICLLAALYPALQASRLSVISVLRK